MTRVDVAVVGGGPAGSSCAHDLARGGLQVLLFDQARFPRDKVCAGWITPDVFRSLSLDLEEYRRQRVLQPITAFRVGVMGRRLTQVTYGRPVSYGIRRVEFDAFLLQRAAVPVVEGQRVSAIERVSGRWVIEGQWAAKYLVGAGGHFCPPRRRSIPAR